MTVILQAPLMQSALSQRSQNHVCEVTSERVPFQERRRTEAGSFLSQERNFHQSHPKESFSLIRQYTRWQSFQPMTSRHQFGRNFWTRTPLRWLSQTHHRAKLLHSGVPKTTAQHPATPQSGESL